MYILKIDLKNNDKSCIVRYIFTVLAFILFDYVLYSTSLAVKVIQYMPCYQVTITHIYTFCNCSTLPSVPVTTSRKWVGG